MMCTDIVVQIFYLDLFVGTNSAPITQKWSLSSKSRSQHFLCVHSFVLGKKESEGFDDKFGGGNVITETLAASVVTCTKLQNTAILFQAPQLPITSARKRRMS